MSMTVPAKKRTEIQVPMNFTYVAINDTDATCRSISRFLFPLSCSRKADFFSVPGVNWYQACRNHALNANGTRPGTFLALSFPFRRENILIRIVCIWTGVDMLVELSMGISGLIGERNVKSQITNVACPFELAQNAG